MYQEIDLTMIATNTTSIMFKVTRYLILWWTKKSGLNKLATDILLIILDWNIELKEAIEFKSRKWTR